MRAATILARVERTDPRRFSFSTPLGWLAFSKLLSDGLLCLSLDIDEGGGGELFNPQLSKVSQVFADQLRFGFLLLFDREDGSLQQFVLGLCSPRQSGTLSACREEPGNPRGFAQSS